MDSNNNPIDNNPAQPPQPQPQPIGTPVQPQPDLGGALPPQQPPVQTTPNQSYPPVKKSGLNKGILLAIILGIVAVVAIVVVLIFFNKPSQSDYSSAQTKLNEIVESQLKIDGVSYISTHSATATTIKNDLDTIKTNREKISTGFDELGKMKAITSDGNVKAAYQKVKDKWPKYEESLNLIYEIYDQVLPVAMEFSKADTSSLSSLPELSNTIKGLRQKFEAVKVEHEANKTMVNGMVAEMKKYEAAIEKLISIGDDWKNYEARSAVRDEIYDIIDRISDIMKDWQSNVEKVVENGSIRSELNSLDDAIFEKYLNKK